MTHYDFSTLSPRDFELLVRDLLGACYGWSLEAFGSGPDGGVDLRLKSPDEYIVVQCKHYTGSTFSQLLASVKKEVVKMRSEKPTRYILATSFDLSRTQKDRISVELGSLLITPEDLLGRTDLNRLLTTHSEVERQHFKLWLASTLVLEQIIASGVWTRSEALLEDIRDRVQLYVRNASYSRAADALAAQRVVVLCGAPGVGKSLLAEMLVLTYWNEGWAVVQVGADIEEAWSSWRSGEKQIFLYDDFLGQTSISEVLSKNEDSRIARFVDRVRATPNKRLVLTTRTQILRQAELRYESLARQRDSIPECVVAVQDYSRVQRAHIVYNHLFFSQLSRDVIKGFVAAKSYLQVIDHPNFSPRIIEQVLKRPYLSSKELKDGLMYALARPVSLWGPSFESGLSDMARRMLLLMLLAPPSGVGMDEFVNLNGNSGKALSLLETHTLRALEGTWVRIREGHWLGRRVEIADPSCRDYLLAHLEEYPDTLSELLSGATLLSHVDMLLRYGLAHSTQEQNGELSYDFPKIREYLHENSPFTFEIIKSIWDNVHVLDSDTITGLSGLLASQSLLPSNFTTWAITVIFDRDMRSFPRVPFDVAHNLLTQVVRLVDEGVTVKTAEMSSLLSYCARCIDFVADYELFQGLFESVGGSHADPNLEALAQGSLISALLNEIPQVLEDGDRSDVEHGLEHYASIAAAADVSHEVEHELDRVRERIDEMNTWEPSHHDLESLRSEQAFRQEPSTATNDSSRVTAAELLGSKPENITELFEQLL